MCPPPLVPHKNESCNDCLFAKKPQRMTFYMYRAMGKESYPMQNVNMASLAGVLWYLHREVVGSTPRKFHISRILRFSVTMMITEDYYNKTPSQFGPFVAFDSGSAKHRSHIWKNYGYVVGCQLVDPGLFNYVPRPSEQPSCHPRTAFPCRAPKWYSLPGPCPEETQPDKTPACSTQWPGGLCPSAVVTGSHTCTYFPAPAGEISLDELEGIKDYHRWWLHTNATTGDQLPSGNVEYDFKLDAGIGTDFWDGRHSKENCTKRMEAVEKLFKKKYPQLPASLPEPPCK